MEKTADREALTWPVKQAGTPGQLYDLANDPYEQDDLWDRRPDVVRHLTQLLEKYKKQGRSGP